MKKELSSLDLAYLVKEFQELLGSKVDSITQPEKKEVNIQLYIPRVGKKVLRILPKFVYLTAKKKGVLNPTGFCMALRKYLINARVREVKQVKSERMIEILLEKEKKYHLIIEIFGKGNTILCDKDYNVIALQESQKWKDRELKIGMKYQSPEREYNLFNLSESQVKKALSSEKPLVKKLATELGLGGIYAEELCLLAKIDKNKIEVPEETKQLTELIKELANKKINARAISKDKEVIDLTPFAFEFYKDNFSKDFESFNETIDKNIIQISKEKDQKTEAYEKKIEKIKKVIEKQKEASKKANGEIAKQEKKVEKIYNNYQVIDNILKEITKAKEKYTWDEIKEKLKGHKVVKRVNSKDRKIIIEIQ